MISDWADHRHTTKTRTNMFKDLNNINTICEDIMNLHGLKYVYKIRNINVLFSQFVTDQRKPDRRNFKVGLTTCGLLPCVCFDYTFRPTPASTARVNNITNPRTLQSSPQHPAVAMEMRHITVSQRYSISWRLAVCVEHITLALASFDPDHTKTGDMK